MIISNRRVRTPALLFGVPLLVVVLALLWYANGDSFRQPVVERDVGTDTGLPEAPHHFASQFPGDSTPNRAVINGHSINLEVARDAISRARGLGGRDALANDRGMLFIFPKEGYHQFWMKDVGFALDLIYVNSYGVIVDIQTMTPEPDVPDTDLALYEPSDEALLAFEIGGGLARRYGIEIGMTVSFK